jgi:23S rRNA U2552 (ribose-2'-O)-methylase RlmE/FtsJ
MAANFTGDKMTDALRTLNLCEEAMMFAAGPNCFDELESDSNEKFDVDNNNSSSSNNDNNDVHNAGLLRHGGSFLCKFFACGKDDEEDLMNAAKSRFEFCTVIKPPASRKESAELYLFATGYKGL